MTTIAPGPLTVKWRETIYHPGAPARIALSVDGDCGYSEIPLAIGIPHNDASSTMPMDYQLTVNIPNIDCTTRACALQLMVIMLGSGATCTTIPDSTTADNCPTLYMSCANVRITGTQSAATYVHTYVPPAGLGPAPTPYTWAGGSVGTWTAGVLQGQSPTVQQPNTATPDSGNFVPSASFATTCAGCGYPADCGLFSGSSNPSPPVSTTNGASPSGSSSSSVSPVIIGAIVAGIVILTVAIAVAFFIKARSRPRHVPADTGKSLAVAY